MAKNYVFTIFNFTDDTIAQLDALECVYMVYGHEVCPTTNRPHLQGYVSFAKKRKFLNLAKQFSATFAVMKGTPVQASEYCKKEGQFFERGTLPLCQADAGRAERER